MAKSKQLRPNDKYGRLKIISLHHTRQYLYKSGIKKTIEYYLCECECGKKAIIEKNRLKTGRTKSCGCLRKEIISKIKGTHHLTKTRIFRIWDCMKTRCLNKNYTYFKHYGGRGITICDEWKNDFKQFYDWAINNGYAENLTIDRIDVNGNYEPSNCRWVTMKQQRRNTTKNIFVEINGVKKVLIDWCTDYKIKYTTVLSRIHSGWEIVKALTTPSREYRGKQL